MNLGPGNRQETQKQKDEQLMSLREKMETTEESPQKDKGITPRCLLKDTPMNKQLHQQDRNPTEYTDMNPQTSNGKPTQEDKGEWTSLLQPQMSQVDRVKLTPLEDDRTNCQPATPKELS